MRAWTGYMAEAPKVQKLQIICAKIKILYFSIINYDIGTCK
jgi:hypothetical protein